MDGVISQSGAGKRTVSKANCVKGIDAAEWTRFVPDDEQLLGVVVGEGLGVEDGILRFSDGRALSDAKLVGLPCIEGLKLRNGLCPILGMGHCSRERDSKHACHD